MKQFTSVKDVSGTVAGLVAKAAALKKAPFGSKIGQNKTLGLIFFNPSLRTRMSTQKAAMNLGMNVITMNIGEEGWKLEMEDGTRMDGGAQEHIKDAVKVMSQYVDILGVRSFAKLKNRDEDYSETVLNQFIKHSEVPIVSLESAIRHPLQSLADLLTIDEQKIKKPKIAVTWAPHPRALPQAVVNSFLEWSRLTEAEIVLTYPKGYELDPEFTEGIAVVKDQNEAMNGADIVYAKNWSSYNKYGKILDISDSWMITPEKMALTNNGKFMHCLPVRRNIVVHDDVLDDSIVYEQAKNRVFAAQAVLKQLLESSENGKS